MQIMDIWIYGYMDIPYPAELFFRNILLLHKVPLCSGLLFSYQTDCMDCGSYHVFGGKQILGGKMLPNKYPVLVYHFSSLCIND